MQALKPSDEVDFSRRYTLEEFWALPEREDGGRYELIRGYLYLVPAPDPTQRAIAARMAEALRGFLDANNIDNKIYLNEPIWRREEKVQWTASPT